MGSLALPQPVIGKGLSGKTVNSILEFYQNDEYSRQFSGKKDCVSIGKNVHVSKQLILCKFASLRPELCITVGPKGKYSV